MSDTRETRIVEAMRDAAASAGFAACIGRMDLAKAADGTACIRPVSMRSTHRTSHHQEYEMRIVVGYRSTLGGDDNAAGVHAFTQVCNDGGRLLRSLIDSPYFKPGAGSTAAKLEREQLDYWYRPEAKDGQAGGGIMGVKVTWREP